MPFEKVILDDDVPCPRCNARGATRVEERGQALLIYFNCPKCKHSKYIGMTSRRTLELEEQESHTLALLARPCSPYTKARLEARLQRVRAKKNATRLGL